MSTTLRGCVDNIVLAAINGNLSFIFDPIFFSLEVKKGQRVSFLLKNQTQSSLI